MFLFCSCLATLDQGSITTLSPHWGEDMPVYGQDRPVDRPVYRLPVDKLVQGWPRAVNRDSGWTAGKWLLVKLYFRPKYGVLKGSCVTFNIILWNIRLNNNVFLTYQVCVCSVSVSGKGRYMEQGQVHDWTGRFYKKKHSDLDQLKKFQYPSNTLQRKYIVKTKIYFNLIIKLTSILAFLRIFLLTSSAWSQTVVPRQVLGQGPESKEIEQKIVLSLILNLHLAQPESAYFKT